MEQKSPIQHCKNMNTTTLFLESAKHEKGLNASKALSASSASSPTAIFAIHDLNSVFRVADNDSALDAVGEQDRGERDERCLSPSFMMDEEISTFSEDDEDEEVREIHNSLRNRTSLSIFRPVEGGELSRSFCDEDFTDYDVTRGTKRKAFDCLFQPPLSPRTHTSDNNVPENDLHRANPIGSDDCNDDASSSSQSSISCSSPCSYPYAAFKQVRYSSLTSLLNTAYHTSCQGQQYLHHPLSLGQELMQTNYDSEGDSLFHSSENYCANVIE